MKNEENQIQTIPQEGRENYNFLQVSKGYLPQWRALVKASPLAAEILFFFMEKMGRTTNAVVCSYQTLQEVTGYSRPTVARAISKLKEDRWVDTVKVGSATAYCVNEKVVWQAARDQRRHAIFSATVIASESEQPSDYHLKAKEELKHIPFVKRGEIMISEDSAELIKTEKE